MATAGAVVDRLLRRLASGAGRLELPSDIDQHVAHFSRTLSRLRDGLASVERYFWVRTEVQDWMTKINQIVLDMENLLDEFEDQNGTESHRSGCITEAAPLCSPCPIFLYSTRVNKMKTLRKRLDRLARNTVIFTMMQQPRCNLEQTDMEEEFCRAAIVGRDSDKTKIEELMLQNNAETFCIIPIVSLVGLGKTTLARLIFYDQGEGWNFDLRIWIDLNRKFDLRKIAADIILQADETEEDGPSVVNTSVEIHENLQLLKNRLQERLHGKSCLIILDGLCSTDKSQLDELKEMLSGTNKWMKVLVTTSNEITAELMHTSPPYKLLPLSEDDCWTVFAEKAFGGGGGVNAHLKTIGKQIAKRCDGIPALAIFLGSVVHNQVMGVWLAARDEPIWKLGQTFSGKTKVFSSLNQIYYGMPSALKLCFLYLSIFPKGSVIDKEKLIRQWIALELIGSKHETLPPYVHGEMYIQDLLSIHFLQVTNTHSVNGMENRTSRTALCMHSFVHDFARHLACNDIIILDDREMTDNAKELPFQYALLTYYKWQSTLHSSLLGRARALHILNTEPITLHREAFELLKHLRVLNLSRSCIGEIPASIGRLKQLRYLDISSLEVQALPSSMKMLTNLEGLDLSNTSIQELPSFIGSLQKLKYLNLQDCVMLQNLPATLGHLQTLEHLRLSCCYDVSELVDSLCNLQDLRFFDLSSCTELPQLPPSFGNLMNLEDLNLSSCFNLKQLPESFGNLYCLRFLNMSSCYELKQLPGSLCNLLKLEILILRRCRRLRNLPPSFGDIQNLRILDLTCCEALYVRIGMLPTNLEYLNLQQCLQLRPNRFSNLTRLKFLNLSQCLPTIDCLQSLGYLFNLEYLNLSRNLFFIPVSFLRLQKLHTLDLTGCFFKHPSHSVSQMFLDVIHKMIGLKFLLTEDPMIVAGLPPYIRCSVGIDENWHITTDELVIPDLTRGSMGLRIAESANLQNRPELRFLKLEWTNISHPAVHGHGVVEDLGEEVLEKLQPHWSLEHLELARYTGFVWPTWMMNNMATLLPNLVSLHLFFLGNCQDLPPLGQLINLRHLHIKDMPNLVNLEMGLSGGPQPFKKLTHLKLEILLNLEELPILSITNNGNQQFMFPALEELSVLFCPNLMFKPSLPKCVKYEMKSSNRILSCGEPLGPLSCPSPVKVVITGCRISSSLLQWLESLKTTDKIIIDACVGDDGEAVTSLGLLGIKCTQDSSSSKILNETTNQSSSGTKILHELTTQDGACKNTGHVVDSSGWQSSGQSSLLPLQQNPATTGLGTSIVRKIFPKFSTTLGQSVKRITSSAVSMPSRETPPTSHKLARSKMSAQIPGVRSLNLSLKQVQKATRKFSPSLKLSESGIWEIYKGILPDNQIVAVRRAKKDFAKVHKEAQLLTAINHWSLVRPLCFIEKGNEFIMISEYVSNGSLRQHLHGQHQQILDLNQRILIAIDAAIALTYLHFSAGETLICYNLKTSKILLTESYRAKLTAFEISRSGTLDHHIGTLGYMSPEYVQRIELTAKSDVYSFGVVLLEIISSRGPREWKCEEMQDSGIFNNKPYELQPSTATLVFEKFKAGHIREILDDRLSDHVDEELLGDWLSLASSCTAFEGDDRPRIEEVGERLWEIWKGHRKRIGEPYMYERSWAEFAKEEGIPRAVESIEENSGYAEFPAKGMVTKHQDWADVSNQQFESIQDDNYYPSPVHSDIALSPR